MNVLDLNRFAEIYRTSNTRTEETLDMQIAYNDERMKDANNCYKKK